MATKLRTNNRHREEDVFTANDGMELRKHFTKRKVRTHQANIRVVIHLPGVKTRGKSAKTAGVSFFSNEMLSIRTLLLKVPINISTSVLKTTRGNDLLELDRQISK